MTALSLAQEILPSGLPQHVYEDHNRRRKATAIAYNLMSAHYGRMLPSDVDRITALDMDHAADRAEVNRPESEATRNLVRSLLHVYAGHPAHTGSGPSGDLRDRRPGPDPITEILSLLLAALRRM
ncbi:hypothetical protein [Streptomyces sp. NPDC001889]